MQQWLVPIATSVVSFAGAFATAWFAQRGKRAEVQQSGWGMLSEAWERRLEELETDLQQLRTELDGVKTELRAERRRNWLYLAYIRVVLTWANGWKPHDQEIPNPPDELADELAPYLRSW